MVLIAVSSFGVTSEATRVSGAEKAYGLVDRWRPKIRQSVSRDHKWKKVTAEFFYFANAKISI